MLHHLDEGPIINQLQSTMLPLCFVLMPFGKKPAGDGRLVDFDAIYELLVKLVDLGNLIDELVAFFG